MTAIRAARGAEAAADVALWRAGMLAYGDALRWQRATAAALAAGRGPEAVALLEHPPVFTLGARGRRDSLLATPEDIARRGADLVATDRGGDVTFHGPGQLVAYPILDLRRRGLGAAAYVRRLEDVAIATLGAFGIEAARAAGRPGAWVGDAKIAAVGVRVSRGVSRHGLALNVSTDLSWFGRIVPCGIAGAGVASMAGLLPDGAPPMRAVEDAMAAAFGSVFAMRLAEDASIGEATVGEGASAAEAEAARAR